MNMPVMKSETARHPSHPPPVPSCKRPQGKRGTLRPNAERLKQPRVHGGCPPYCRR